MKDLFDEYKLGDLSLKNRMVMAPMTRNRATSEGEITDMMVTHYTQRASAGLIIAESTPISSMAVGYPCTPAIYNQRQTELWKRLTDSVHKADGHIFVQLQHCGRISHPSMLPKSQLPVAPSAIRPQGQAITYSGMQDFVTPKALDKSEITSVIDQFQTAAKFAKSAGFDGIEVHGANGYLIDQFLRDGSNTRTDEYGGSLQNRFRFASEVIDAVCSVWKSSQVGIRLSPENSFNSMSDSSPMGHFSYFTEQLNSKKLAYLHVLQGDMLSATKSDFDYHSLRSKFNGTYIANGGYGYHRAMNDLTNGCADLVAFGSLFLANPDLVRRFKENLPLNEADRATFYGGTEKGYNDYPYYGG
ncbi:MAG: alkene reductase [Bacteriovoracia bacterium]